MIQFLSTLVQSYDLENLTITWDIAPTAESLSDYEIDISRAETPGSVADYIDVVTGLSAADDIFYKDLTVSGLQTFRFRDFYYRLKARNTVNLAEYTTAPFKFEGVADITAKEVIRRQDIVLSERYSGKRVMIVKKRTHGTVCPDCFDTILGKSDDPDCLACMGTGWSVGYYAPIESTATITNRLKKDTLRMWSNWEATDVVMTMSNFPTITTGDLIIDNLNRRYHAVQIRTTEKGQHVISQQVQMREFPRGDIAYDVQFTWA